jgi:N-acetylmuramoyl-L-alanine amidase
MTTLSLTDERRIIGALNDRQVRGLTIWGEARGEPPSGQAGVAWVIRHRVEQRGQTYKAVCLAPRQFSCWNSDDPTYPKLLDIGRQLLIPTGGLPPPGFVECDHIGEAVRVGSMPDPTGGATNYMTTALYGHLMAAEPDHWCHRCRVTVVLGGHTFLREQH